MLGQIPPIYSRNARAAQMIKAVNEPLYEITCDLCATVKRDRWTPPNWETINIALADASANLHICQECLQRPLIEFFNRVRNPLIVEVKDDT